MMYSSSHLHSPLGDLRSTTSLRSCWSCPSARRRCNKARASGQQRPENTGSPQSTDDGPQLKLADPVETIAWGGRLPSTRRVVVGGLTALGIVLGGNLGGITSFLFGLDGGKLAGKLRADLLLPVKGFKRCVDYQNGYEFRYPAQWLADQTMAYRAAARAEAARGLDPPSLRPKPQRQVAEPSAAFGPPGGTGEKNVSVIVAPIFQGFRLAGLGAPAEAAQRFLDTTAAPPGSNKTAQLVAASSRVDDNGILYYQFEFVISSPSFSRHNISVLATQNDFLYTMNVQCPQRDWGQEEQGLQLAAASFQLLPGPAAFPGQL